ARHIARDRGLGFWLIAVLLSIPVTSIVGFALARFGWFSLLPLGAIDIVIAAVLSALRAQPQFRIDSFLNTKAILILTAIGTALFIYYAPPFEYYFGGRDPGIYVINGIRIARTGSFTAEDPLIEKIPRELRTLFLSEKAPMRYMGFLVASSSDPRIVPNFFYLYPVWLAIFYTLFGVHGMLYATLFLMLWMLLAAAFYVAFVLDRFQSFAFVILLGTTAISLWFARFPNSEVLAGALIWLALFCFLLYRQHSIAIAGFVGAVCLALSFWTRVDAILLAVPLILDIAMRWIDGKAGKNDVAIIIIYFLFVLLGTAHVLTTNSNYILAAFENLKFKPYKVALVVLALSGSIILLAIFGKRFRISEQRITGLVVSIVLAVLLAYSYFIRPFYPASNIGSPNAGAFLALGWYFTHPVVVIGLFGLVIYSSRFRSIDWILFAGTLVYAILYFYRIRGHAEHFWMLRRYLMLICPALVFFTLYGLREILGWLAKRVPHFESKYASTLALLCALAVSGWFVYEDRDLHKHHEYAGSLAFLSGLSERIKDNDVLLISARDGNDLHIIGPLLSYFFDRNVLLIRENQPDLEMLNRFQKSWKGNVYLAGTGGSNIASRKFYLEPLEDFRFETPVYDEIYHRRPRVAFLKYFQIGFYKFSSKLVGEPHFVDVGRFDDANVTSFHLKEKYREVNYRWTNGKGHVYFRANDNNITNIVLRINPGPWVPGMEKVRVKLYVNKLYLVDLILGNGYNTYDVPVPATIREKLKGVPVDLLIESKSWIPKRVLNLPDMRRVGVIVDWVKLRIESESVNQK
ncbi:hypothetical protein L0244_26725, partial [bacterium]|nr:hypothetical protein [bacterium]